MQSQALHKILTKLIVEYGGKETLISFIESLQFCADQASDLGLKETVREDLEILELFNHIFPIVDGRFVVR
jgi:hypothetical protein